MIRVLRTPYLPPADLIRSAGSRLALASLTRHAQIPTMSNSTAEHYHSETKYAPGLAAKGHSMDWNAKPSVFKEYAGAETIDLKPALRQGIAIVDRLTRTPDKFAGGLTVEALSRLMFFTNGVTAAVNNPGEQEGVSYFRAAPSAGALYPTELYLIVRRQITDGPEPGTYNFNVRQHQLVRVAPSGFGPEGDEAFEALGAATKNHPALRWADYAVVMTTVFYRSSWRYGPRGYRRCMLDTGHVAGNLAAYAPHEGYGVVAIPGFVDQEVNELVGVDGTNEAACLVMALIPGKDWKDMPAADFSGLGSGPDTNNETPADDALLSSMVSSTKLQRESIPLATVPRLAASGSMRHGPLQFAPGVKLTGETLDLRDNLPRIILARRSTRALSGDPVRLEDLQQLLEYSTRWDLTGDDWEQPAMLESSAVDTWVVAQRVDGLPSGVYLHMPESRELRQVEQGDFRGQVYRFCLEQQLAANAAAVVIHTADLASTVRRWGNRGYRMLHLDAGHMGHRLNLACIAKRLGVSGIGGFYDDQVNELLGLGPQHICCYITCIGQPAQGA